MLHSQQKEAKDKIFEWLQTKNKEYYTVGGFAGTGKTTLIKTLLDEMEKDISVCTFTGKAAKRVNEVLGYKKATTIHRLVYKPILDHNKRIKGWIKNKKLETELIIIDEASMLSEDIFKDLLSYRVPILMFGDPFQLPPVVGNFNAMNNIDYMMTEIHRQAEDSPIIQMSIKLRNYMLDTTGFHTIKKNQLLKLISSIRKKTSGDFVVITHSNKNRVGCNQVINEHINGDTDAIKKGTKLICLRNNDFYMNGEIVEVEKCTNESKYIYDITDSEENTFFASVEQFHNPKTLHENYYKNKDDPSGSTLLFDYGYCITGHKSQGSEWDTVVIEIPYYLKKLDGDEMFFRWLYTAVTRCKKNLFFMG